MVINLIAAVVCAAISGFCFGGIVGRAARGQRIRLLPVIFLAAGLVLTALNAAVVLR